MIHPLPSPSSGNFPSSSAEDVSTTSESDHERDYQTDFTTPDDSDELPSDEVESFRDREYPQLKGRTYLDHAGTTLYAKSFMEQFSADMINNLYGNPHSASSPSAASGHRIDRVRLDALRFFNADPQHFDLVFVANATAAIKLVIDCVKDHASSTNTPVWYGYHKDAHTSLVGIREITKLHRCFTSDEEVDIWINSGGLGGPRARQLGLFAYPGQSNMTGRRLPLSWPGRIRRCFHKAATYTLLDAAALATTAPLDLSDPATAPDFTAISFYKIFGFPNIGALIVRKESSHVLDARKYFSGGTVEMVISIHDTWHAKKEMSTHDRLEDGTLPFHSIFALDHAMRVHRMLYGEQPMKFISHHTAQLGKKLYDGLCSLRHSNGVPVIKVYKDSNAIYGDPSLQGATVAFNVVCADGSLVGFEEVEQAADVHNIFVRSGSLCNPGGMATYLNWTPAEMRAAYAAGHRCSNPVQLVLGKPTGVVRVSLGAMSTNSDIRTLLRFLRDTYVDLRGQAKAQTGPTLCAIREDAKPHPSLPMRSLPDSPTESAHSSLSGPRTYSYAQSQQHQQQSQHQTQQQHGGSRSHQFVPPPPLPPPPPHQRALSLSPDPSKAPRFNPEDYANSRRPWQDRVRKEAQGMALPELEESSVKTGNATPSVKARKFGRSMVNLLRTKGHYQDTRYEIAH